MPYLEAVTGTLATATYVNEHFMDQAVCQFTSAANRDAELTTPINGQVCITTDNNAMYIRSGGSWFRYDQRWQTYTPEWDYYSGSGTSPSIGNGSLVGRYKIRGDELNLQIKLIAGSTTSGGSVNPQFFRLPADCTLNPDDFSSPHGYGLWYDSTLAARFALSVMRVNGTAITFIKDEHGTQASPASTGYRIFGEFTAAVSASVVQFGLHVTAPITYAGSDV